MVEKRPVDEILADAREIYGAFGKAERALTMVDRALEMEPNNVDALNLKASILYELDRDDEARAFHLEALEYEPNSVEALYGLASLANDHEQYAEGLEWLARAFRAIPKDPYPEFRENEDYRQRLIAELYNERALALWYTGKREEAEHLLSVEAPEICPLEVETFEEQLEWLQHHPDSPEE